MNSSFVQRRLSFADKGLKLDRADSKETENIRQLITDFTELECLELCGNTLGVEACEQLGISLECHPTLKIILFSDIFTGRLKTEIPDCLRHLGRGMILSGCQLTTIDLSDNAFGPNGLKGLIELLESSVIFTLRDLKLNNNGLGITGGKMLAQSLLNSYYKSKDSGRALHIEKIVIGRNRLENAGAKAFAKLFQEMGSLIEVEMPQNGISHDGVAALSESFLLNSKLQLINLEDNTFTNVGSKAMASTIACLNDLRHLNFGDCLIRSEGCVAIAHALRESKIEVLNLSHGEICLEAALELCNILKDLPSLSKLDLDGNNLGEIGCDRISDIINRHILQSLSEDEGSEIDDNGGECSTSEDDDVSSTENSTYDKRDVSVEVTNHEIELGDYDMTTVEGTVEALIGIGRMVTRGNSYDDWSDRAYDVVQCSNAFIEEQTVCIEYLLQRMGLLKSESKCVKPVRDGLAGLLQVLECLSVRFGPFEKAMLALFLEKENKQLVDVQKYVSRCLFALKD